MHHVETRYFAILEWIKNDLIKVEKKDTADNCSDALTKATERVLFYNHNNTIMYNRTPLYVQNKETDIFLLPLIINEAS